MMTDCPWSIYIKDNQRNRNLRPFCGLRWGLLHLAFVEFARQHICYLHATLPAREIKKVLAEWWPFHAPSYTTGTLRVTRNQAWLYSPLLGTPGVWASRHPGCNSSFQRYLGDHKQQQLILIRVLCICKHKHVHKTFNIKTAKVFELRETPP